MTKLSAKESIVDSPDYKIRFTELTDEAFLKEMLNDEETRKWYPPSSESDVNIFVRNWVGFSRYKCSLTALYKDQVIAVATIFLMPYVKVAHLAMLYMIVDKKFSRKGVGRSILRNINHLAKTRFKLESLHLEVFENSPIENLLPKEGYKQIIFQENYVQFKEGMRGRKIYEVDLIGDLEK
jgi:hypothetical protein